MKILDWNLILRRDNFFLFLQILFTGIIVFFSASGLQYPTSVFLALNTIVYLLFSKSSKELSLLIKHSWMAKIFLGLVFSMIVSYSNIYQIQLPNVILLQKANTINLFVYSLVWFLNFLFVAIYIIRVRTYKMLYYLTIIFFLCALYSNWRAYNYNRLVLDYIHQLHYYYFVLVCLPILFLCSNKWVKYTLIFIATLATFYCFKRSGIFVCGIISLFCYLVDTKQSVKSFLIGLIVVALFYNIFWKYYQENEAVIRTIERMEMLSDDGGSGRSDNIVATLQFIDKSTIEEKLFGHGFMSMLIERRHMVDVEWIAIYYYHGWLGLIFYTLFHFLLIKRLFSIKQIFGNNKILSAYIACWTVFAFYSFAGEMFSYQYLSSLLFVFLGMVEGLIVLQKKQYLVVDNSKKRVAIQ